jgi:hypothetical protein
MLLAFDWSVGQFNHLNVLKIGFKQLYFLAKQEPESIIPIACVAHHIALASPAIVDSVVAPTL